jgi:hypothetical protein
MPLRNTKNRLPLSPLFSLPAEPMPVTLTFHHFDTARQRHFTTFRRRLCRFSPSLSCRIITYYAFHKAFLLRFISFSSCFLVSIRLSHAIFDIERQAFHCFLYTLHATISFLITPAPPLGQPYYLPHDVFDIFILRQPLLFSRPLFVITPPLPVFSQRCLLYCQLRYIVNISNKHT